MTRPVSLGAACAAVLRAAAPRDKVMLARRAARDWRLGRLAHDFVDAMPARPARPPHPLLLPPNRMPKRGRGGTADNRVALLHALAHIEFAAIDLALDLVGRFGAAFPRAFADDWMRVGAEEAIHFALLDRRLRALGSHYGALPAHDGLWEAAEKTAHDARARLAIVPMVLEARGLDVTPPTIARFESAGDAPSARILRRILSDEIRHVGAGVTWFRFACAARNDSPAKTWRWMVETYFRGTLKPPFNDSARAAAGLTTEFYNSVVR
ncbi:ferritin-like domain-containing protein [Sphingomonas sp.]|uniref:ferritin-like domain-containing protein n=1 Tax=Sphingomonas sp. TaxID=28214 RepID=UPI003B3B6A29